MKLIIKSLRGISHQENFPHDTHPLRNENAHKAPHHRRHPERRPRAPLVVLPRAVANTSWEIRG